MFDGRQRTKIVETFKIGGYGSTHPSAIVGAVIGGLTSSVLASRPSNTRPPLNPS
ncbi:MAG: hypothetical protein ACRD3J_07730 [Thermoanaerobaculia bacterium]